MPTLAPGGELAPDVVQKDFDYYYDQAREICRRVRNKKHLTDDEIIILAVVAAQLALAKYIEPGERNADETLNHILSVLDRNEVNAAISSKMDKLLEGPRGAAREDAPGGATIGELASCKDPDEPSGR